MSTQSHLNSSAEFLLPPFSEVFHTSFLVPFLIYFTCFRLASLYVKTFMWQQFTGIKEYRLKNLSICLLHAMITGIWSTVFFFVYTREMFENIIHWYQPWAAQLPIISVAYFVHDAFDMITYEWSRWTIELLFHHITSCFALLCGILPRKFLLANYWALLMEGNRSDHILTKYRRHNHSNIQTI
ncbi:hypothetical protein DICVIV_11802 [Dictyocaulus viviparus]|uniref:TLC domain-containing protein n=1 Tax=Dictyocaulus viviparus TaxID=29172 RepID=A0A0D8XCA5_DICVI|nr:hypothetical protein DICVIV_11802 [Dictyocaulus viviparus]